MLSNWSNVYQAAGKDDQPVTETSNPTETTIVSSTPSTSTPYNFSLPKSIAATTKPSTNKEVYKLVHSATIITWKII